MRVAYVADSRIADTAHDCFGRAVRAVVDNEHFHVNAALIENALDRIDDALGATISRHDNGNVDQSGSSLAALPARDRPFILAAMRSTGPPTAAANKGK